MYRPTRGTCFGLAGCEVALPPKKIGVGLLDESSLDLTFGKSSFSNYCLNISMSISPSPTYAGEGKVGAGGTHSIFSSSTICLVTGLCLLLPRYH